MLKLDRTWTRTTLGLLLVGAACTNDYDEFDFDGTPTLDGGAVQGSGGQVGRDGASTDSGGAAGDARADARSDGSAAGATGSGGSGGAQGGGGSGAQTQGTGGQAGGGGTVGSGGAAGTAGSAGTCGQFQIRCDEACIDARTRSDCGGCGNDCAEQGLSSGFECIDMACGCTSSSECGSGPRIFCSTLAARCSCEGDQCQAGERCSPSGNCSCNGGPPCEQGEICCQTPSGCRSGSCE